MIARTTRRRATIEYMMKSIWDQDFIKAKTVFNTHAVNPDNFLETYRRFMQPPPSQADLDIANKTRMLIFSGTTGTGSFATETPEETAARQRVTEYNEARGNIEMIRAVLNHFELLAIGIREGIIDEVIFRRWYQTGFIRDWEAVSDMVRTLRRDPQVDRSRAFIEIENLATRWKAEGLLKTAVRHFRIGRRHIVVTRSR